MPSMTLSSIVFKNYYRFFLLVFVLTFFSYIFVSLLTVFIVSKKAFLFVLNLYNSAIALSDLFADRL